MATKTRTITKEVREVLAGIEWDQQGDRHIARLTSGQLDRKLYVAVNDALMSLGGKWDKKAKGHVFSDEAELELETLIETGEYRSAADIKQDLGQFDTPEDLASEVIRLADVSCCHRVLEPNVGTGNFIRELLREKLPGDGPLQIDAYEVDSVRGLRASNVMGDPGLKTTNVSFTLYGQDFLRAEPEAVYDRVIMNPPFAKQADIDHVTHAWKFVKPGGRLVAIMSAGWTFRTNKKSVEFKQLVDEFGYAEPNPENSFAESGTNVRTCTVVLEKPE